MTQDQTFYADLRHLRAWFKSTAPGGGRAVYAVGSGINPQHEVVRQVVAWVKAGDVVPVQSRIEGTTHYLIDRSRKPVGKAACIPPAIAGQVEGRMLAMLDEAARHGLPCPSYKEMADALDLRDRQAAAYRFRSLIRMGLIQSIESGGRRTVVIVGNGARTANPEAAAA